MLFRSNSVCSSDLALRLSLSKIGEANILCARTRPKLIGGERAKYTEED